MSIKGSAESYIEMRGSISIPTAIVGKSAYEVAVANGFDGTEEEWLASLHGAKIVKTELIGQDAQGGNIYKQTFDNGVTNTFTAPKGGKGDMGDKGDPGYTPQKGVDYNDGADGKDGYTPKKGVDYFDGEDGKDGKDGTSVSVRSITESSEDGAYNVVSFTDGKVLNVKNGKTGGRGEKGATGEPGVSATHSWDGTKLFVSSASGTSYADLKGDKGDKGDVGSTPDLLYHYLADGNVILPETTVTIGSDHFAYLMEKCTVTVGKEYFVIINGVKTKVTATVEEHYGNTELIVQVAGYGLCILTCYDTKHLVNGNDCYTFVWGIANTSITLSILEVDYMIDPRYIPNMYYEEDGGAVELLPESKVYTGNGIAFVPGDGDALPLVVGETYTIILDGQEYVCEAFEYSDTDITGVGLGDKGIYEGSPSGTYPFFAMADRVTGMFGVKLILWSNSTPYGTVSIYQGIKKIHRVDPKYINNMYFEKEIYGWVVPVMEAIDNGYAQMGERYVMGEPISLVVGKTYKVTYNDVEYDCVAKAGNLLGESVIILGDAAAVETGTPSGEFPFVLATGEYMATQGASFAIIPLDGAAQIYAGIMGDTTILRGIPRKFIDGYAPMYTGNRVLFSDEIQDVTDGSDLFNFITMNRHRNKIRMRCGGSIANGIYTFERVTEDYGCLFMFTDYDPDDDVLHNLIIRLYTNGAQPYLCIRDKII